MVSVSLICSLLFTSQAAFGNDQIPDIAVKQTGDTFVIDATVEVPVPIDLAWDVLTDFDHMTSILENLTVSKVISRNENIWHVRQEGVAKYGPFSYSFESVREIHLEPKTRIVSKNLSGTLARMNSLAEIIPGSQGVQIKYHIEMETGSLLARMFGLPFVRHDVENQLQRMAREMTARVPRSPMPNPAWNPQSPPPTP
jgi:carbon monoxide dehydrogenase subunit G